MAPRCQRAVAPGRAAGGPGARAAAGRTVDGRRASSTTRRGRRPPSGGACPGRRRAAGWPAPATASGRSPRRSTAVGSGTSGLADAAGWIGRRRTSRPWGERPAARRHGNLGKSGYQSRPGGRRIGLAPDVRCRSPDGRDQAGTNSWSSRWIPSHRPQRPARAPRRAGDRDRSHDLADLAAAAEQVALAAIHRRTQAGSPWNWNGPGLIDRRSAQATGDSAATMSRRLTRHGRAVDHLAAAVAAPGDVVADDRPDLDAHDLHRRRW